MVFLKSVLMNIPQQNLGSNIWEIDLWTQLMPDSTALGLIWDVEGDQLCVQNLNLTMYLLEEKC